MNPQDPLAALHPLREPALIGWWPLAPGWWAVLILLALAIIILGYHLLKRYRANTYRRLGLAQLEAIRSSFNRAADVDSPVQGAVRDTNALLKTVALRTFPRHDIAALSGEAWLSFLNETRRSESSDSKFSTAFANAAYRAHAPELDIDQLFQASKNWIKKHRAAT